MNKEIKSLTIDLEDMMETASAVQGEAFADLIAFVMNSRNLVKLFHAAIEVSIQDGKSILHDLDDPVSKTMLHIMSANTSSYADALQLSGEKIDEALKVIDAMTDKINSATKKMMEEE